MTGSLAENIIDLVQLQDIIENNEYYSEADLNNDDSVNLFDIDFITNLIMSGN